MRVARFFALVLNSDARDYADEITWNCISRQPPHYSSPLAPSSGSTWELLDEREMSLASDGVAAAALLSFSKANFPRKYFGTCGECTSYIYYATSL